MDIASVGGIVLALVAILGAMMMEGGNMGQVTQLTAAMIVIGGTAGAVLVQFPLNVFLAAVKGVMGVFLHKSADSEKIVAMLVEFANKARKSGIVSLDADLGKVEDPFLKQGLMLAVDGTEPSEVRKIMQHEIDNKSEIEEKIPQVFESAGASPRPWASSARYLVSSRSCSTWTTSTRWVKASQLPLWRPSMALHFPISSACRPPAS